MSVLVQKFGGSSLATIDKTRAAARIIGSAAQEGRKIAVIASAMGDTTDELLSLASSFGTARATREMDLLLASGEQISSSLLAMALNAEGLSAQAMTGPQAGIYTDRMHGSATITRIKTDALRAVIEAGRIPIVAGYQGQTETGEITTLGRGGSDTTAIAVAGALRAERCDIYTDVDGVYSADPRLLAGAVKLETMSISQMLALADAGAQVMSSSSMRVAQKNKVPLRVRSAQNYSNRGTLIGGDDCSLPFCGIAVELEQDLFSISPVDSLADLAAVNKLVANLGELGISAEQVKRVGTKLRAINYLTVSQRHIHDTVSVMRNLLAESGFRVECLRKLSKISVVGQFDNTNHVMHRVLSILLREKIVPSYWTAQNNERITFLVSRANASLAMNLLHENFLQDNIVGAGQAEHRSRIA